MTNTILPPTLLVTFCEPLGEREITLEDKSTEWILWAISNGVRQSVADAKAGKAGTVEGDEAVKAKFQRICIEGQVPSSGGGGGPRQDTEAKGWIAYFGKAGHKEAARPVNGKTLGRALDSYCRQVILASAEDAEQRREFVGMMQELLEANRQDILDAAEADTSEGQPGYFIELERQRLVKPKAPVIPMGLALKLKAKIEPESE